MRLIGAPGWKTGFVFRSLFFRCAVNSWDKTALALEGTLRLCRRLLVERDLCSKGLDAILGHLLALLRDPATRCARAVGGASSRGHGRVLGERPTSWSIICTVTVGRWCFFFFSRKRIGYGMRWQQRMAIRGRNKYKGSAVINTERIMFRTCAGLPFPRFPANILWLKVTRFVLFFLWYLHK